MAELKLSVYDKPYIEIHYLSKEEFERAQSKQIEDINQLYQTQIDLDTKFTNEALDTHEEIGTMKGELLALQFTMVLLFIFLLLLMFLG